MKKIVVIILAGLLFSLTILAAPVIKAPCGAISGIVEENGAYAWLGIPYAQETSGKRRFLPPQACGSHEGVFQADKYSAGCPQIFWPGFQLVDKMSEDSLTVNIWAPSQERARYSQNGTQDTGSKPVLVFVHGGGFARGSGSEPIYNGANLAQNSNIVVVTFNYRLAALGFLYLAEIDSRYAGSGNNGLLDQIAALKWLKCNIAAFGGDPDNITVAGQSAGAASVACLLTIPEARGLFNRAILQSGGYQMLKTREQAAAETRRFMKIAGCKSVEDLQSLNDQQLLVAQRHFFEEHNWLERFSVFGPVRGDTWLPEDPLQKLRSGCASGIAVLTGTNNNEMGAFGRHVPFGKLITPVAFPLLVPPAMENEYGKIDYEAAMFYEEEYPELSGIDALMKIFGSYYFFINMCNIADAQSRYADTFVYRFDWGAGFGAVHGLEIPFVFGNTDMKKYADKYAKFFMDGSDRVPDERVTSVMQAAWVAFAVNGNPSNKLFAWPRYDSDNRYMMRLDVSTTLDKDIDGKERRYWRNRLNERSVKLNPVVSYISRTNILLIALKLLSALLVLIVSLSELVRLITGKLRTRRRKSDFVNSAAVRRLLSFATWSVVSPVLFFAAFLIDCMDMDNVGFGYEITAGIAYAIAALAALIGRQLCVRLRSVYGWRPVFLCGMCGFALYALVCTSVSGLLELYLAQALAGAAFAAVNAVPGVNGFTADATGFGATTRYKFDHGKLSGCICGLFAGLWLYDDYGVDAACLLTAASAAFVVIVAVALCRNFKTVEAEEDERLWCTTLQALLSVNRCKLLVLAVVLPLSLLAVQPLYLLQLFVVRSGDSLLNIGWGLLTFVSVPLLFGSSADRLLTKCGSHGILLGSLLLFFAGQLITAFGYSLYYIYLSLLVSGCGLLPVNIALARIGAEHNQEAAAFMATIRIIFSAGMICGCVILGTLYTAIGLHAGLQAAAIIMGLSIVVYCISSRDKSLTNKQRLNG